MHTITNLIISHVITMHDIDMLIINMHIIMHSITMQIIVMNTNHTYIYMIYENAYY
jgi:hypothetical protein